MKAKNEGKMTDKADGHEFDSAFDLAMLVNDLKEASDDFDAFAEDVLLSVIMPEVPRHMMEDKYGPHLASDAAAALFSHMEGYRKMLAFFRKNGVDVNEVVGGGDKKSKS